MIYGNNPERTSETSISPVECPSAGMSFIRNSQGGTKIIVVLLSLALIGGGIFGFGNRKLLKQKAEAIIAQQFQGTVTSDWEIYRDDEFGFEVKYPKGWDIAIEQEATNLREGVEKRYSIFSGGLSFDIFVTSNNKGKRRLLRGLLETPIRNVVEINFISYSIQRHLNISGFTAVMYYSDLSLVPGIQPISTMDEAMLRKGETIFHFRLAAEQGALLERNKDIFKQILSTFRFIK